MIELLSPVGDFETLKAAVQNNADSVYFGANIFSARAFAHNFDLEELKKAIEYAKIRGVKTHLTLNTLIKDTEFNSAINLAKKAYEFGIDAIIVQDFGLAMQLIKLFPDLPIHASTQMTVHNLNGALELQSLGFKRIVLSRELSTDEIEHICKNTNIEIECFAHGALCISYSGQCLFSSIIGGRSGNRGKCAQPCRLPYELLENNTKINSGYLLSTKDLYSLEYIPFFIKAGVKCLKIEGRMKSPEYVATVTRIYKKYINLALSNNPYIIDPDDKKELMQVFNRGMSSNGHLNSGGNQSLIFKEKPNNMGIFLGKVQNYNENKGHITVKLQENISIGDTIALENENGKYTISELMEKGKNITKTKIGQTVVIGRMKGNISPNNKIYKMSSKKLSTFARDSYKNENRKIFLSCNVKIKKNDPISIEVFSANNFELYKNLHVYYEIKEFPTEAQNKPLDIQTIKRQISKTASTPYEFKQINIELTPNTFLSKISLLNELRRKSLEQVSEYAKDNCKRILTNYESSSNIQNAVVQDSIISKMRNNVNSNENLSNSNIPQISLLLNNLNLEFDYSKLKKIDNIYIPLKFFINKKYHNILKKLSSKANLYIYMPTIIKGNYNNLFYANAKNSVKLFDIKGFVVSNICNIKMLNDLFEDINDYFKLVSNYTFNVFNNNTVLELKKLGISKFTLSPELDLKTINTLCEYRYMQKELIVYGRTPLMNMNYCPLGESNKCYPECSLKCNTNNSYFLKDRLNMKFPIMPDNIQTVSTIFNSKITSISPKNLLIDSARIDILDESIEEINNIITTVINRKSFRRFNLYKWKL